MRTWGESAAAAVSSPISTSVIARPVRWGKTDFEVAPARARASAALLDDLLTVERVGASSCSAANSSTYVAVLEVDSRWLSMLSTFTGIALALTACTFAAIGAVVDSVPPKEMRARFFFALCFPLRYMNQATMMAKRTAPPMMPPIMPPATPPESDVSWLRLEAWPYMGVAAGGGVGEGGGGEGGGGSVGGGGGEGGDGGGGIGGRAKATAVDIADGDRPRSEAIEDAIDVVVVLLPDGILIRAAAPLAGSPRWLTVTTAEMPVSSEPVTVTNPDESEVETAPVTSPAKAVGLLFAS